MADNVPITAGSGTNVATDERTINATTVHIQRVIDIGATSIVSGQTDISTTASIVAARETRKRVQIINRGSTDVYVGPSGVTTSNGALLKPNDSIVLHTTAAVHGVSSSGTNSMHYIEEYD